MHNSSPVKIILILAANPQGTSALRLEDEIREIDEGLRRSNKREQYKLEQKLAVRSRDFYRAILDYQPYIVHFCGHALGDGIVLEDDKTGEIAVVETNTLASMFKVFAKKSVECVILNACYSEVQAEAISQYVNYVVGMNKAVGDQAAKTFATAFYDAIAAGYQVKEAYELGCSQMRTFLEHETPVLKIKRSDDASNDEVSLLVEEGVPPNPYQGLSAFKEEDTDFFFGQETFVNELVKVTCKQPLIAVVGPSGCGKSSAVYAGLVPRLRKEGNWLVESFRPGETPFFQLACALTRQLEPGICETHKLREAARLADDLQNCRITLQQVVSQILQRSPGKQLLLIADQFEELYTLSNVREAQDLFSDNLLTASLQKNITLVFTLRADFYGHMLSYRPFRDALQDYTPQLLSSMNREELQKAIELPAQKMEVQLEFQLTQKILDDVGEEPGNLPLLEFALTELWKKQINRELTHRAYEEIGGVKKAIANHAEAVYQKLNETEKKQAQRIFMQLVRPGEGTEDTRRVATRAEVGEENWNLVSYLAGYQARLVVTGRQEQKDTVEIVHEALLREWGTFRNWISESREFRIWQERLKVALREWKNNSHDSEGLLRGMPLNVAESWLHKHPEQLSTEEKEFIHQSLSKKKQKDCIKNISFISISIGLILVSFWLILIRRNVEITSLAASSNSLSKSNKEFDGLIEILKASRKLKPVFLIGVDSQNRVTANLIEAVYNVRELNRLKAHQDWVTSVSFSEEGQILTSGRDRTIKLWSKEGRLLKNFGEVHNNTIWKVSFSPNSQYIASASKDKTVKVWIKQKDDWVFSNTLSHNQPVRVVKFSPNGEIIASADDDSNIKFWSKGGQQLGFVRANQGKVLSMSFKDNTTLATGGEDSSVKFWRSKDGTFNRVDILGTLEGHGPNGVWSLDFSKDGKMLTTGGRDGTIKLWRKEEGSKSNDWIKDLNFILNKSELDRLCESQETKKEKGIMYSCLKASRDYVRGVKFSPDNKARVIAAATWDKRVLLWYWNEPGRSYKTLRGHGHGVWDVSFSPDGKTIASASADSTVKLWNREETKQAFGGGDRRIFDVSFSPNSDRIASASQCQVVKQRSVNGNSLEKDLIDTNLNKLSPIKECDNRTQRSHNGSIYEVAFSPRDNNQIIATASSDCTVKLWDFEGRLLKTFIDTSIKSDEKGKKCSFKASHSNSVKSVAFSPDGKIIASAGSDSKIKLWSLDGKLVKPLEGHTDEVNKVRFSPDSKNLVSAGHDNTVRLWDRHRLLHTFKDHSNKVRDVTFSPDGKIIASASHDQTIKLWNRNGKVINTLYGHSGEVESVSFSPDSQMIASGSLDHTIKIWNLDGILLNTINVSKGSVFSVSFSPNGQFLAAGIDDGQLRLWEIELNKLQKKACNQVQDYLRYSSDRIAQANRHLCD